MCTLTWHDTTHGYRVFFNRDERQERQPGRPPEIRRCGDVTCIAPLDGDCGGTWIVVNEYGLTVCVLNGFSAANRTARGARRTYTTRGDLPLRAAANRRAIGILDVLHSLDLERYRPFLLVALETGGGGLSAGWSGTALDVTAGRPSDQPLVSSSFFTEEVRRNRVAVFRGLARTPLAADPTALHVAFHRSHAPTAGPLSPCMHRPEASTVSFSQVGVDDEAVRFRYVPHAPCRGLPSGPDVVLARRAQG